jgi:hypothetical protein
MAQSTTPSVASQQPAASDSPAAGFAPLVLRALAAAAAGHPRRQADLAAALRDAGLPDDQARLVPALRLLTEMGCVANLMPLAEGGVLLTVTGRGLDGADQTPPDGDGAPD